MDMDAQDSFAVDSEFLDSFLYFERDVSFHSVVDCLNIAQVRQELFKKLVVASALFHHVFKTCVSLPQLLRAFVNFLSRATPYEFFVVWHVFALRQVVRSNGRPFHNTTSCAQVVP